MFYQIVSVFEISIEQNGGFRHGVRGGGLRQSPLPDRQGDHRQHGVPHALPHHVRPPLLVLHPGHRQQSYW